jgi:hypothetical protein
MFYGSFCCVKSVKNTNKKYETSVVCRVRSHVFYTNKFHVFPCFSLCKKYKILHAKSATKAKNLCRVWFHIFYTQVSCLFRVFRCVKSMKLYTQKVQQKHVTFVVSGLILLTQKRLFLVSCF